MWTCRWHPSKNIRVTLIRSFAGGLEVSRSNRLQVRAARPASARSFREGRPLAAIGQDVLARKLRLGQPVNHPVNSHRRSTGGDAESRADYDAGDWAWEFLRRNEDYIADWRCAVPRHLPYVTLGDGTKLLRLRRRFPRAEQWGLYAFADPALSGRDARVFWHAKALKRVVRMNTGQLGGGDDSTPRSLADFRVDRRVVLGVDGPPLVLLKGRGTHVPLAISGLSVLTSPFAPVYELHNLADLSAQTELLKRLQRFTEPDPMQKPPFTTDERLHQALIALDESLAGKSYREIAITIFGEKRVAEEWYGPSLFLKDRIRRLVAKGTELMKGGYRDLLL